MAYAFQFSLTKETLKQAVSQMSEKVVEEHPNNTVVYPKGLPNDRGSRSVSCGVLIVVVLVAIAARLSASEIILRPALQLLLFCFFGLVTTQLLLIRFSLLCEERHHIHGRYGGSKIRLFRNVWNMNMKTMSAFIIGVVYTIIYCMQYGNPVLLIQDVGPHSTFFIFIAAYVICNLIKVEESKLQNSIMLERMNGMDYGSGMAYNFFYGYLDIVLPNRGGSEKGMIEKIEDYIDQQGLNDSSFPVKKLFIIIPSSAYTPSKLSDIADGWMEPAGSLESHILNRAGVQQRVYKNSVYRIKNPNTNDEPVYVAAEGATPLKSLHDAISRSGENQVFYREHLQELMSLFYKTLRKIIKADRDCRDLCEIVYYIDLDEHGNRCVNIAELLLYRIDQLKNMQRL
ncbi:stimulator of interferon genes protein homolog isoform X1 [Schistocerca nitens]|uniref:stimulator of interferon genes protein homolog isoform X1 n=1 Tax=Schistocerca nitens TaxID=7011 RepID=UPI002117A8DE|nr:stimulator of interferon genes protein homolog isoform X1 [Schistocerca nitens]